MKATYFETSEMSSLGEQSFHEVKWRDGGGALSLSSTIAIETLPELNPFDHPSPLSHIPLQHKRESNHSHRNNNTCSYIKMQ
jgi:hypothetical protein